MAQSIHPNFLIVGAAKAGTTSLSYWLQQHPDVFLPTIKEPSYFVFNYGLANRDQYYSLFAPGAGKQMIGEASTAYLTAPESAAWIAKELGMIKIIIILRHPVKRALSLYAWMAMEGYEWLPDFSTALEKEFERFHDPLFYRNNPEFFWDYMYFHSGLYVEQVNRYFQIFGKDNVGVYLFDDLVKDPRKFYIDVCGFLSINPISEIDFSAKNVSRLPRSVSLQFWLRHDCWRKVPGRFQNLIRSHVPLLMKLNCKLGSKPVMPLAIEKELSRRYQDEIIRLSDLLQRDLSCWLS
ncbi:MAG: sulfotransferase domain-containing protein [Cyanobacteria bacterium]|nr:sulfotransferase domain-containing protein [Cyanobacteriota bacterium]MDW8201933.1 sulfotransferase domain-containing protein [Cyanobacteriota bacterium SKYGB_h_bin112]